MANITIDRTNKIDLTKYAIFASTPNIYSHIKPIRCRYPEESESHIDMLGVSLNDNFWINVRNADDPQIIYTKGQAEAGFNFKLCKERLDITVEQPPELDITINLPEMKIGQVGNDKIILKECLVINQENGRILHELLKGTNDAYKSIEIRPGQNFDTYNANNKAEKFIDEYFMNLENSSRWKQFNK